jgi:hypothetical protein
MTCVLPDLIALLEMTTGPDRFLDAKIWCAVHPPENGQEYMPFHRGKVLISQGDYHKMIEAPHYTTSVDAAMTLIPPHVWWMVGKGPKPLNGKGDFLATIWVGKACFGATPALALCIAVLKARM